MRTTVTLDPDTEQAIRARMAREGVSFKQALNETIRDGLRQSGGEEPFVTPAFHMGVPRVDLDRALAVSAALEDAEITGKLSRGA